MTTANENLLVKFSSKNTQCDVTPETDKTTARKSEINETEVIYQELSKFAGDVLPAYELDSGPLTSNQIKALRNDVAAHYPRGELLSRESLFK